MSLPQGIGEHREEAAGNRRAAAGWLSPVVLQNLWSWAKGPVGRRWANSSQFANRLKKKPSSHQRSSCSRILSRLSRWQSSLRRLLSSRNHQHSRCSRPCSSLSCPRSSFRRLRRSLSCLRSSLSHLRSSLSHLRSSLSHQHNRSTYSRNIEKLGSWPWMKTRKAKFINFCT